MYVYVDPFVAGVICTLIGQFIGVIIYTVIKVRREKKNNGKDRVQK